MIDRHEAAVHDAAAHGAQVMCFQELFYGPYFCQVQDPRTTTTPKKSPTARRRNGSSPGRARVGMVLVLPMYERRAATGSTTTPPRSSTPTAPTSASTASNTSPT